MSKLFKLIKINFLTVFNLYKIKNARGLQEIIKESIKFLLLVALYAVIGFYIYFLARSLMESLITIDSEYLLLGIFFAASSVLTLFTTILKTDSTLFKTKDYDMLMSLPIKKITIIMSKILNLYFSNLIFIMIIMIPILIVYVQTITVNILFYLIYILSLFIIPLIPTIVAILLGSVISLVSSRFKFKKSFQLIFSLIFMVAIYYFSFQTSGTEVFDIANFGNSLMEICNKIYPLTNLYMEMLINHDIVSGIIFMITPIAIFIIISFIVSLFYSTIITKLLNKSTKKNYKITNLKLQTQTKALLHKEFKRFIGSPNYILNSMLGGIALLGISIVLLIIGPNKILELATKYEVINILKAKGPMIIGLIIMFSCTSSSSISLEGKNLWILKSLPVDESKIFISKILLNFLLVGIPSTILSIITCLFLDLGFLYLLSFILSSLIYSALISTIGLVINLHFPLFEWKTEIKVIKQSMSTFLTMVAGALLGLIPLSTNIIKIQGYNWHFLVIGLYFVILIALFIYLHLFGKRVFKEL